MTGTLNPEWTKSTDSFGAFEDEELWYEIQISRDGKVYDEDNTIVTDPGEPMKAIDLYEFFGLEEKQYFYAPAMKLRIRAATPLWPEEGEQAYYYSDWVESNPFAVDLRITPSAPSSFAADSYEKYETESTTFTIGRPEECNALNSAGQPMGLTYTVELEDGTVLASSEGATAADESVVIEQAIGELPVITASGEDTIDAPLYVRITPEEGDAARYEMGENMTIRRFRAPHITLLGVPARIDEAAVVYFRVTDTGYAKTDQNSGQMGTTMYYNISGYGLTAAVVWKSNSLDGQFVVDNGEDGLDPDHAYNVEFWLENDPPDDMDGRASNIAFGAIEAFTPILVKRVLKPASTGGNKAVRSIAAPAAVFGSDLDMTVDEGCVNIQNNLTVGGKIYLGLNEFVEFNGDDTSGYYKFADGRLECYYIKTFTNVDINSSWASSCYYMNSATSSLVFPVPFTRIEYEHAICKMSDPSTWVTMPFGSSLSLTNWSNFYICSFNSRTGVNGKLYMYARGRWN